MGEGQPGLPNPDDPHNDIVDPLQDTFALAHYLGVLPSKLLAEDDEILSLYEAFLSGLLRGREIRLQRGRP